MRFYYTAPKATFEEAQQDKQLYWRNTVHADLEDGDVLVGIEFAALKDKRRWQEKPGVLALPPLYSQEVVSAEVKTKLNAHLTTALSKQAKALSLADTLTETDKTADVLKKLAKYHGDFIIPDENMWE